MHSVSREHWAVKVMPTADCSKLSRLDTDNNAKLMLQHPRF